MAVNAKVVTFSCKKEKGLKYAEEQHFPKR